MCALGGFAGSFSRFGAHWREKKVTATLSSASKDGTLEVTNQYGDTTSVTYRC